MAEGAGTDRDGKALIRLLRFALSGPLACRRKGPGADVLLVAPSGGERGFSAEVFDHALSRGLLREDEGACRATPEARAFLRRLLSDPGGEGFQDQHRRVVAQTLPGEGNGAIGTVRRNLDESPLAVLSRLKDRAGERYFPDALIAAGDRLAANFHRGGLQPRVTARWEPKLESRARGAGGANGAITDSALSARLRVARAADAMGPELSGVALDICCFMKGLEEVERERCWPARSAKLMLRTALSVLARHYDPPRRAAKPETRHWGVEGYRPRL